MPGKEAYGAAELAIGKRTDVTRMQLFFDLNRPIEEPEFMRADGFAIGPMHMETSTRTSE
jgi:hypothetical protein